MRWLSTAIALVVLASCASDPAAPETGPAPEALWGEAFLSTAVTRQGEPWSLVPDTEIRVSFEERGAVGFDAGCNLHGADLEITAERLLVGSIMATEMACPGARDEQDGWLVAFFRADPRWELEGDRLTLTDGTSEVVLRRRNG